MSAELILIAGGAVIGVLATLAWQWLRSLDWTRAKGNVDM